MVVSDKYIKTETLFSTIGAVVVSALIFVLVFGHATAIRVPVQGAGAYAFDFLPQSFFGALLCTLLPGLITLKRLAAGADQPAGDASNSKSLFLRGLMYAMIALACGAGVFLLLLLSNIREIPWVLGLIGKMAYGAVLGVIVTPLGLHALLRTRVQRQAGRVPSS